MLCFPEDQSTENKETDIDVFYASVDVLDRVLFHGIDSNSFINHYILDWEISSSKVLPKEETSPFTRYNIEKANWKGFDNQMTIITTELNINDKLIANNYQINAMTVNLENAIKTYGGING